MEFVNLLRCDVEGFLERVKKTLLVLAGVDPGFLVGGYANLGYIFDVVKPPIKIKEKLFLGVTRSPFRSTTS